MSNFHPCFMWKKLDDFAHFSIALSALLKSVNCNQIMHARSSLIFLLFSRMMSQPVSDLGGFAAGRGVATVRSFFIVSTGNILFRRHVFRLVNQNVQKCHYQSGSYVGLMHHLHFPTAYGADEIEHRALTPSFALIRHNERPVSKHPDGWAASEHDEILHS